MRNLASTEDDLLQQCACQLKVGSELGYCQLASFPSAKFMIHFSKCRFIFHYLFLVLGYSLVINKLALRHAVRLTNMVEIIHVFTHFS